MAQKKMITLSKLETFLDGLKSLFATKTEVGNKADVSHNHDSRYYTESEIDSKITSLSSSIDSKVSTSRTVNSKALSSDITLTASDVGADASGAASSAVSSHNTNTSAHNDIRALITNLTTRLNSLADSDDTTLDQLSEIVAYIKANRELIESVTTSKVNVSDIINNLTTNVSNKPLSAAQGVILKGLIDTLQSSLNSHTHNYAGSSSAGGAATSAVKLETSKKIGIGGGATSTATSFDGTSNISIPITGLKEAYLEWGGKNFADSYSPIDAAVTPRLGANRFAFMPSAAVTVEYSQDGGVTWHTYSLSDEEKKNLFNGNSSTQLHIGGNGTVGIDKSNHMLRVTINQNYADLYTVLNKFVIYISIDGSTGSYCTIDAITGSNCSSGTDEWVTFADKVSVGGWSGFNVINTNIIFGYNDNQYRKIRFTFGVESHASTIQYGGLKVFSIMGFGGVGWQTPSNMAASGHLYSYDAYQNATFPASVTANTFYGNLDGTFTGTVDVAHGGTGATTASGALSNLGLTATATELNYLDGATSNVQAQLDNLNTTAGTANSNSGTALSSVNSHTANKNNPHEVTAAQVGLGNVNNTSDADKPISDATQGALNEKAPISNPTFSGTVNAGTTMVTNFAQAEYVNTTSALYIGNFIISMDSDNNRLVISHV